ncbi:LamG-like jellyroll fold domain-containing protein [Natronorubrum daqingense]|uniref:Concanavalin A-like lectin/glucanases superfamily protein n=1 Tax=Natronorubrum daqingense TaxID=588898 RepID=A0A1N7FY33_9EURY|nr:LamG-like jellyroll fold domain-containing protein [Natronorubrum daqingense]APX98548.1 hypothetical protein BB347_17740 [Natronorubrum daqingense]SIS05165.1 Concanavalin A-like lectin/glucanases superfamily protein [Natronorubrum daqingense]
MNEIELDESVWNDSETVEDVEISDQKLALKEPEEPDDFDDVIHHWEFGDGEGNTATNSTGDDDAELEGVEWVSGDWVGGYALENSGNDYVNLGAQDVGSALDDEFTLAFTVESSDSSNRLLGVSDSSRHDLLVEASGDLRFMMEDSGSSRLRIETSDHPFDGDPHRCVFVKDGNSADDMSIYIDGEEVSTSIDSDENFGSPVEWDEDLYLFAENEGGANDHWEGIIDNLIIADSAPNSEEIESDYADQPWSDSD